MQKIMQQEEILKYVYKEIPEGKRAETEKMLFGNEELEAEFYDFLTLKKEIDEVLLTPKKKTIDSILAFSKSYKLETITQ